MSLLVDSAIDARDLLGKRIDSLWQALAETESFEGRVALLERYLREVLLRPRRIDLVSCLVDRILTRRGGDSVSDLAAMAGLGVRQFERRFLANVGMTPKYCTRIARFQAALDLRLGRPDLSWLQIAHEVSYFDQMHLVRDFKAFAGMSPTMTQALIGDQQPQAWIDDRSNDVTHSY